MLLSLFIWVSGAPALASPDCAALDPAPRPLVGVAGDRKIAYIVGIGKYAAKPDGESIDLIGPPNDARRIRDLLIERYGFPVDNICTLVDSEATRKSYVDGWRKHVGRASQGDIVVYYFAGHGSQTTDFDGPQDESDKLDETILLHDSRATVPDLLDDEFNALLAEAYRRTKNITVIVDACNSGSATRSAGFAERRVDPLVRDRPLEDRIESADGDYRPGRFPEMVTVTAAQDGTSALERGGQGVFTNALLRSLDGKESATWSQLVAVVPRWIAAQRSFQQATFEGNLDREVFGKAVVDHSLSWQVHEVRGDRVEFRGPAMPGWSVGAVLDVFEDGTVRRRGRVRLDQAGNFQAQGVAFGRVKGIAPGDYAVLDTPGEDAAQIRVQIADSVGSAGALRRAVRSDEVLAKTVRLVDGAADFVVRQAQGSMVEIVGSEGVVRNRMPLGDAEEALAIAYNLGLHARQASLIALSAEPNDVYPHDMLALRIAPDPSVDASCARERYAPSPVAVPYVKVPNCTPVGLEVTLAREPRSKLHLGILYLANDGTIEPWPQAGIAVVLTHKGDTYIETLGTVTPPLDAPDRILVFGSHEPVRWSNLKAAAIDKVRGIRGEDLQSFVVSHVSGTRGIADDAPATRDPAWTSSFLQVEVTSEGWSAAERADPTICDRARRAGECR